METASNELVIFGAKSIALGACIAIKELYPQYKVVGFMVSRMEDNADKLCGLPVKKITYYTNKNIHILVATPDDIQENIAQMLTREGFRNLSFLDSRKESELMKRYYAKIGRFPQLRENIVEIYMARFHKDKFLKNNWMIPWWVKPIQVGASLTDIRIAELTDNVNDNISDKNVNYCELTALYWIWKNRVCFDSDVDYYGLFQYRRILDVSDEDFLYMKKEKVDVVLPYPTIHEPNISEHHSRYIKETDWEVMLQVLSELQPRYADSLKKILKQSYLYNYNIFVAKKNVLKDYCEWLFPILEKTEQLSNPKGNERADRYIGYLGENLLTLYFMSNSGLNIKHCGKIMLT